MLALPLEHTNSFHYILRFYKASVASRKLHANSFHQHTEIPKSSVDTVSPNSKLRIGWRPTLSVRIRNSESVGDLHSQPEIKIQNRLAADTPSQDSKLRIVGGRHCQPEFKTQNQLAADTPSQDSKLRITWRVTLSVRKQNSESRGG